jgi:hypothetical protein
MSGLAAVSFKKRREHHPRLSTPYVPGVRHERFWTDAEIEVIKTYYPDGGADACLAHLPEHRTPSGVYVQAGKLGLTSTLSRKKIPRPEGFDDALREFYQNGDGKKKGECNAFADRLKVPRWWVTKRAIALGLVIPHKKEPPWTAAENELMKKVPLHDVDKCAEIFREHGFSRSPTAIMVRAKRLDLSRRYRETLSATAISKILGVDSKTVTREIIQGDLKATKRKTKRLPQQGGDHWSITPADLRRYLLDHLERIDLRKVDKFAFVQIIAGEALST